MGLAKNTATREVTKRFGFIVVLFFCAASALGGVGKAYWGSFGEGAGRIECVVFENPHDSILIGYDDETSTAVLSDSLTWGGDGSFEFSGVTLSDNGRQVSYGGGRVTDSNYSLSQTLVLDGELNAPNLVFEAFEVSVAQLRHFQLVGNVNASIWLVEGEADRSYFLYLNEDGFGRGGAALRRNGNWEFITPEGDEFFIADSDEQRTVNRYVLEDGRSGRIFELDAAAGDDSSGTIDPYIEGIWYSDVLMRGNVGRVANFILEGEGSVEITLNASAEVFDVDANWDRFGSKDAELYRLSDGGIYELYSEGISLEQVKSSNDSNDGRLGAFDMSFEGSARVTVPEGIYFLKIKGFEAADAYHHVEIDFLESPSDSGIKVANLSAIRKSDSFSSFCRLGFCLAGEGLSRALIRDVGPSLKRFGMKATHIDPMLSLYKDGFKFALNNDWENSDGAVRIQGMGDQLGAFDLNRRSADAALELQLDNGDYELNPSASSSFGGFELLEVYFE